MPTDTERALATLDLISTYGVFPQEVGREDGTEDDFGDLICAVAEILGIDSEDQVVWDRVQNAAAASTAQTMSKFIDEIEKAARDA